MKKTIILFALLLVAVASSLADDILQDTIWVRKTDQMDGFYMVKFSNTDSLIVGHGYQNDLFFDAKTGTEIKRIGGNNEVFFINNDANFIRLNQTRTKFEIFDLKTWEVIDTLENDGALIGLDAGISKDERYLVSEIQGGFRIWDISTKKILKTKIYPPEEYLQKFTIDQIKFLCDGSKIISTLNKEYKDPDNPKGYYIIKHIIYDFNTLDSIDVFEGMAYYRLSNICSLIAFKRSDPTYGVELYDFNTKKLLHQFLVNGPSLTGVEFSKDDKYLVTTNGPGPNRMDVWNLESEDFQRSYFYQGTSFMTIDISNNDKYFVSSAGYYISLFRSKFHPSYIEDDSLKNLIQIFPNPTKGELYIQLNLPDMGWAKILLTDTMGNVISILYNDYITGYPQKLKFDLSFLSSGTYNITVNNSNNSYTYKLIVNK
jgi:hypothetical protein